MKKTLRHLALAAAAAVLISVTACEGSRDETTTSPQTTAPAAEFTPPDFSSYASPLSINGREVSYDFYRYFFLNTKYTYDHGDETYWDTNSYDDEIKGEVLRYLQRFCALEDLAQQLGVTVTQEDMDEIEASIEYVRATFESDGEYLRYLDSMYMTEESNDRNAYLYYLNNNLFEYLTNSEDENSIGSDETLVRSFLDNYVIRADQILILDDYGDDKNENEELIKRIYKLIEEGGDFEQLRKQYSEDEETNTSDIGRYLMEGDVGAEFERVAFALNEGEMSEVVRMPYGWAIIKRYAKDAEYINENMQTVFVPYYQSSMFEIMLRKMYPSQQIVYSDSYSSLGVETVV